MSHYLGLNLTEEQHTRSSSHPSYSDFYASYSAFEEAEDSVGKSEVKRGFYQHKVERKLERSFLPIVKASAIMNVLSTEVLKMVKANVLVGVKYRRKTYVLKESIREQGFEVD